MKCNLVRVKAKFCYFLYINDVFEIFDVPFNLVVFCVHPNQLVLR